MCCEPRGAIDAPAHMPRWWRKCAVPGPGQAQMLVLPGRTVSNAGHGMVRYGPRAASFLDGWCAHAAPSTDACPDPRGEGATGRTAPWIVGN